jgi:hypothetical protein
MKHTPGPWKRLQGMIVGNLHKGERGTEGDVVCLMKGYVDYKNQDANARLIAAAPELLETLRFIVAATGTEPGMAIYKAHIQQAEAAIAKAEGREP